MATGASRHDRVRRVEEIARREMGRVIDRLDDDALLRSRAKIATAAMLSNERPMGRMTRLGSRWTYGLEYTSLDEEIARIDAVGIEDVRSYLSAFPMDDPLIARGGG